MTVASAATAVGFTAGDRVVAIARPRVCGTVVEVRECFPPIHDHKTTLADYAKQAVLYEISWDDGNSALLAVDALLPAAAATTDQLKTR
jgi:hypothetical protein